MDLHLTSEQTLLRDSAAKFIGAAGPKVARGFREQEPSFAPARLRHAGELGWLGILVPPSADGLGLGLTELALVLEQAGRASSASRSGSRRARLLRWRAKRAASAATLLKCARRILALNRARRRALPWR